MRILVTGGAGYVGSISAQALLDAGHSVAVLDDLSTGHPAAVPDGADLTIGSYADAATIAVALEDGRIEAVLHCGARSLVGESVEDPSRYYLDNVAGGIAMLNRCAEPASAGSSSASSAAVYGIPERTPIDETTPLAPINPYGETKRTFEGALRWYASAYGLRSLSLRYFNVAGATRERGEDHDPETHLIPNVLAAAVGRRELTIFGDDYPTPDGTPIRDYIDVRDLADAHLRALEATDPSDPRSGADPSTGAAMTLNLGNGDGFSVREVLAAAETVVGAPIPHRVGPRRAGDPPILVASAARAGEVLGWRPRCPDLETMIGSAWEWRRRNPDGYPA